jgi:hypothetical protein
VKTLKTHKIPLLEALVALKILYFHTKERAGIEVEEYKEPAEMLRELGFSSSSEEEVH